MKIKKFHNPENLKSPLLKQFVQSLYDQISDDDVEHYSNELFNILNGEEIITNDQNLLEMFNIFQQCIHIVDENTIRFICNGIVADLSVELEEE